MAVSIKAPVGEKKRISEGKPAKVYFKSLLFWPPSFFGGGFFYLLTTNNNKNGKQTKRLH